MKATNVDQEVDKVEIEIHDLDTHPDTVLQGALAQLAGALDQVRAKLAAGTIDNVERDWLNVMVQASAGLLAPATEVDLADYLWSLAQVHNERVNAARQARKKDAPARGLALSPVKRLPIGRAETEEHMQGKRKGQLVVVERDARERCEALMREGTGTAA